MPKPIKSGQRFDDHDNRLLFPASRAQAADSAWTEVRDLFQRQDYTGARALAEEREAAHAARGEKEPAATYALMIAECDARLGEWEKLDRENLPRKSELLALLDPEQKQPVEMVAIK